MTVYVDGIEMSVKIDWIDALREPQVAPNPDYPDGIDIDGSNGAPMTCHVALPYPAKRCGAYIIECKRCGVKVAVTTAGRADDPRSITLACKAPTKAEAM